MTDQPRALVDAELYLRRCTAVSEYEIEWAPDDWTYACRHGEAKARFQDFLASVRDALPDHQPHLCLGTAASFRYSLFSAYKANRKASRKPAGYSQLIQWVIVTGELRCWNIAMLAEVEADDVMGILYRPGDVIVSEDKDMLGVPGLHLRGTEFVEVSEHQADLNVFSQALIGDTTDNYPGCPGIGKVTAEGILAGRRNEFEMWCAVLNAFTKAGLTRKDAITQVRLARILRAGEYDPDRKLPILWNPPDDTP
jgi:DNA polymerase-1